MNDICNISAEEINKLPIEIEELPTNSRNYTGYDAFLLSFAKAFQNLPPQDREEMLAPWRQIMGADDDNDGDNDENSLDRLDPIPGLNTNLHCICNRLTCVREAAGIWRQYQIGVEDAWRN